MPYFRRPIVSPAAAHHVLLMALAFAISVVATRLYLDLTGYPQVGNETFHLAHALWGGLLQIIGTLLLLVFLNRWVHSLAAVLAGVGVGLFMDEVGKFITQRNDYFFPLAAPIIYVAFLLVILVYLVLRRQSTPDSQTAMYTSLYDLIEVLEEHVSEEELSGIVARLESAHVKTDRPDVIDLAAHLLGFLQGDKVRVMPDTRTRRQHIVATLQAFEARSVSRKRLHRLLVFLLALHALGATLVILLLIAILSGQQLSIVESLGAIVLEEPNVASAASLSWFLTMAIVQTLAGFLTLVAAFALFTRHDRQGIAAGSIGLIITLTITNILSFYFNQFSVVLNSLFWFAVLLLLQRYRHRFLGRISPTQLSSQ